MIVEHLPEGVSFHLWPFIERMLAPASQTDVFDPDIDVLWIAHEGGTIFGAATTRLRSDGVAELRLAGGTRFRDWIGPLDEAAAAWARLCGSPKIVMSGRTGWARFAPRYGWTVIGSGKEMSFEKDLGNG